MSELARQVCRTVSKRDEKSLPLFILTLPNHDCDYDALLPHVLDVIETDARDPSCSGRLVDYELLIFCAGSQHRPSWPWLIQAFTHLDRRYKKALQKLFLVHEKSWVRVCMQLLENLVSPKFSRKIRHVKNLAQLREELTLVMDLIHIPAAAQKYDDRLAQEDRRPGHGRRVTKTSTSTQMPKTKADKRRTSPPAIPAPRSSVRDAGNMLKTTRSSDPVNELPCVPPRRSSSTRGTKSLSIGQDYIIYEDPDDQFAAEIATSNLEALLATSATTQTGGGVRSSSAPSIVHTSVPRRPKTCETPDRKSAGHPTLRRAISGPLTPSSATRQNFIPTDRNMPPPLIKIHGKEVTVKSRKPRPGEAEGKVGGLKALFEQKALVARSMS